MKILHLTDSHLTAKTPTSRQDIYYQSLLQKFKDLTTLIHDQDIDFVIHTGDVFHTPRISLDVAGKLAHIFLEWGVPIYVVPGNHDIDGYNLSTIHQTMLGFLARTGVIQLLTRHQSFDIPYDCPNGARLFVHLEGQEYYDGIDRGNPMDYALLEPKDFNILAVHGMLMEKPYFPEVPHTLIEQVETDADVVLVGHYHPGFQPVVHRQTQFLNPGSFGRVEIAHREPKAYILEILHQGRQKPKLYLHDVQNILLPSASLSDTIFDFEAHEEKKTKKQNLLQFKASIEEALSLSRACSTDQLLDDMAQTAHFSHDVVVYAKERIEEAKRDNPNEMNEMKGYQVAEEPIGLTKVEIENFLSHKRTVLTLHPDLNVLIGETNSGKSAILRAIIWCLYNEPKGVEFLRTGEKKVTVTCHFSNGYRLTRSRTDTQSGYYEITSPEGEKQKFSGFGTDVPIQISNVHQMPAVFLSKDLALKLNVNEQLEGPFLIAESPQRKAQMVGRLVGTQSIDHAIKQLNKELLGYQRTLKVHQEQVNRWEQASEAYHDLPLLAEHLAYFESVIQTQETLEREIQQLRQLKETYEAYQVKKKQAEHLLASLPDLTHWQDAIEHAETMISQVEVGFILLDRSSRLEREKIALKQTLIALPDLNTFDTLVDQTETTIQFVIQLNGYHQQWHKTNQQKQQLNSTLRPFDEQGFQSTVQRTQLLLEELEGLRQLSQSWTNLYVKQQNITQHVVLLQQRSTEHEQQTIQLEQLLRQLYQQQGMCPTCGTSLQSHQIDYLMEHSE